MRIGKRADALIREAAVAGYVNGVWATGGGFTADIPPDTVVTAGAFRTARSFPELYPTLSRVELPDDHLVTRWLDAQQAGDLEALRALIDERLS
ncbi:MAG TPA: hypothetical protein VE476_00175 [Propionibacteriaceae bacterium]|nr:hypothetical protein [Propionibacteriaceae bacterium]